jgi:tetrapyrrole methylase family protein/MazG family protein
MTRIQRKKMDKSELAKAFLDLNDLISRLRAPGGCPWDAQQTEETIKTYLLEETYEVVDAVDRDSSEDMCHELGDLLFQVLFLTSIAQDRGHFDLGRVIREITDKMVHRHPHVFGRAKVASAEEVAENWEKIKKKEIGVSDSSSKLIENVPANLPALLRAHRLIARGARLKPDDENAWTKVQQAFEGLGQGMASGEREKIKEGIGALLFSLASLARDEGLNAEHVLREANQKFVDRFRESGEDEPGVQDKSS